MICVAFPVARPMQIVLLRSKHLITSGYARQRYYQQLVRNVSRLASVHQKANPVVQSAEAEPVMEAPQLTELPESLPQNFTARSLPNTLVRPEELPVIFSPNAEYLVCARDCILPTNKDSAKVTLEDVCKLTPRDFRKHYASIVAQALQAKHPSLIDTAKATPVTLVNAVNFRDLQWHDQLLDLQKLPSYYLRLSKIRLTGLVVLTSFAGYLMAPAPTEPLVLLTTAVGTLLTSCSANAINQFLEVPYDSQMARTKNRVLVKGMVSPLHAVTFAAICGSSGLLLLTFGVNGLTATLGAINLLLYTSIYTPMKRISIVNTWVGSIVGAIPPMMGWAACTGHLEAGAWLMGAILYSWQFPHFNALSWNLRPDYSRAGYRMMSVTDPSLCRRTALRHTASLCILCLLAPLANLTTWNFVAISLPLNAYFLHCAWNFYHKPESSTSRKLFRTSLVYLPALVLLMLINKYFSKEEKMERKSSIQ